MSKLREARGTRLHHESQCAASCITYVCAYVLRLAPIDTAADDSGGTVGKNRCDTFRGLRVHAVTTMLARMHARTYDARTLRGPLISRRAFDILNYPESADIDYRRIGCLNSPGAPRRVYTAKLDRIYNSYFLSAFVLFTRGKLFPQPRRGPK